MNNLPSANNAANARREMRSAHKAIAKRNAVKLTADQKMNRAALELVKNGLVTRIKYGFLVSKSIFGFIKYEVISGKCTCFGFADNGMCEHALAGRAFADIEYAEAEKEVNTKMTSIETPEIHNIKGFGAVMIEEFPTGNKTIYNAVLGEFKRAAMTKSAAVEMVLADARNARQTVRENF